MTLPANGDQTALESLEGLIERILDCTRSPESRNFYRKAIATLGKGLVEEELGELKDRVRTGRVRDEAKYFTTLLKTRMEELTPVSNQNNAQKTSPQKTHFSQTLPDLFGEMKETKFQENEIVRESFMEVGYAKNRVPWATFVGPEFFTLSTNKRRSDFVQAKIRTFAGDYEVTLFRGKAFPEDPNEYGILTATQARILGALGALWNSQQGQKLHDKAETIVCRCTFSIRELAEALGWKRAQMGKHAFIDLKSKLVNLNKVPYCYQVDPETASAVGLEPKTYRVSFQFLDGVDFFEKKNGLKSETRCAVRFSPQYSSQLIARRVVGRSLEIMSIRSELAVLVRQYIEPILMSMGEGREYSIELERLTHKLNLPMAGWHRYKSARKRQFGKAIKEVNGGRTSDGLVIRASLEKGFEDFMLVARLVRADIPAIQRQKEDKIVEAIKFNADESQKVGEMENRNPLGDMIQQKGNEDQTGPEKDMEAANVFIDSLPDEKKAEVFKLRDQIAMEKFGSFSEREFSKKLALVEAVERMRCVNK